MSKKIEYKGYTINVMVEYGVEIFDKDNNLVDDLWGFSIPNSGIAEARDVIDRAIELKGEGENGKSK